MIDPKLRDKVVLLTGGNHGIGAATARAFAAQGAIDRHFAVNARAHALLMARYLPRYRQRGASWGRIINISTDAAHAHVDNVSYAASKHAIEPYSRSAAAEMGKYGITVNIVAPGLSKQALRRNWRPIWRPEHP